MWPYVSCVTLSKCDKLPLLLLFIIFFLIMLSNAKMSCWHCGVKLFSSFFIPDMDKFTFAEIITCKELKITSTLDTHFSCIRKNEMLHCIYQMRHNIALEKWDISIKHNFPITKYIFSVHLPNQPCLGFTLLRIILIIVFWGSCFCAHFLDTQFSYIALI